MLGYEHPCESQFLGLTDALLDTVYGTDFSAAINAYMSEVANTAASKLAVSEHISVRSETKTLEKLSSDADAMSDAIDTLQDAVNAAKALPTESEKAVAFHDNVLPVMDALRAAADDAETICGEDYWPLPSYSKMLYYV